MTLIGLEFAILLAGAVLTETTFSWPGMGRYLLNASTLRDYTAVQAVIAVFAIFVALITLVMDSLRVYRSAHPLLNRLYVRFGLHITSQMTVA